MKILTLIISFTLILLSASLSYAGPGHGHSHGAPVQLDDKGLISAASQGISAIVKQKHQIEGKALDEAWINTPDSEKSISKKGRGYSIVKFENKITKQNLFILLSDAGQVYDANFTGQFSGLKN